MSSFIIHLRRNVVAYLALFIALGGSSYAATKLPPNSVGTKQLKTDAVTGAKVKDNSLTGSDINESKLGLVPGALNAQNAANAVNAQNAANAAQLGGAAASSYAQRNDLQPEGVRAVGGSTQDCDIDTGTFCTTELSSVWHNYGNGFAGVGFRKDSGGFVHLQGIGATVDGERRGVMFYLPEGYRPTDATHAFIAQVCNSGGSTGVDIRTDGAVYAAASCLSLDGITFHP